MIITFNQERSNVLFVHEDVKEYNALVSFPGFLKSVSYHYCPAVLPVAYSLISRITKNTRKFPKIKIHPEVSKWLESDFKLAPLPEDFVFHSKPLNFQEIALRYIYTLGSAGLLLAPGMGKSKVVLDYIKLKKFKKSVIVCPSPLLFVWEDEVAKHRPDLSIYVVRSTDWEAEHPGIKEADITVINYNKAVIFKHRLKEVGYEFIHLDEFLIKDPSTARTQALTEIARTIPYRAGGSGTLINNSPMDAFCPVRYLQPALVGWNYGNFLKTYAVTQETPIDKSNPDGPKRNAIVAFKGQKEIRSILESCSIVMTKEQWLKLPEKHFHDIFVQPSPEQKAAYYQLLRNYRIELQGHELEIDNPLVMLSKLYQISQGFIYFQKETEKQIQLELFAEGIAPSKKTKRHIVYFEEQPKIEALKNLLTTKLAKKKAIIWFNLEGELKLIEELLIELGTPFLTIKGGDNQIGDKVRAFNKDPSIRWLACQSKAVNYGITVLGSKKKDLDDEEIFVPPDIDPTVSDQVFYSINFSLEVYLQQQDRTHRLGQEQECNYYRIFLNTPVERRVRDAISDKVQLREEMLIDVAQTLLKEDIMETVEI